MSRGQSAIRESDFCILLNTLPISQPLKKVKLKIQGMHCASCEILIERKFKKIAGTLAMTCGMGGRMAQFEVINKLLAIHGFYSRFFVRSQ